MLPRLLFAVVLSTSCSGTPAERPAPDAVPQGRLRGGTLAVVRGAGLARVAADQQWVALTPTSIDLDGRTVVTLMDGKVPVGGLAANNRGREITALARELRGESLTVYLDRNSRCRLLTWVAHTAGLHGVKKIDLVVMGAQGEGVLTIRAPVYVPSYVGSGPQPPFLGLILAETRKNELLLFAAAPRGKKGTIDEPYLTLPIAADGSIDEAKLRASAVEVAATLGPGPRRPEDHEIVVLFDDETPFQHVVSVLDAVRSAPDGTPLFPTVELGYDTFGHGSAA